MSTLKFRYQLGVMKLLCLSFLIAIIPTESVRRDSMLSSTTGSAGRSSSSTSSEQVSDSVPWHSQVHLSKKDWDNLSRYHKLPPTVFAPQGRLHSVEQTMKAVSSPEDPSSNLVIALRCRDGMVVVTTVSPPVQAAFLQNEMTMMTTSQHNDSTVNATKSRSYLPLWLDHYEEGERKTKEPMEVFFASSRFVRTPFLDNRNVWAITAGNAVHSQIFRRKIQSLAESIWESNDDGISSIGGRRQQSQYLRPDSSSASMSAALLARKLADQCQITTQTIGTRAGRMLVSSAIILGPNDIWQVDPTGQFWQCHVAVVGKYEGKARSYILEQINAEQNMTAPHSSMQLYLDELSKKRALILACEAIHHSFRGSQIPFVSSSSPTTTNKNNNDDIQVTGYPRLMALSLQRKVGQTYGEEMADKVTWYSQEELIKLQNEFHESNSA